MGAELNHVYVRVLRHPCLVSDLQQTSTVALMPECHPGPAIEYGLGW